MKKVYSKPIIIIENFSLVSSIAGDCEVKTDLQSNNTCGLDFSGVVIFLDTMNGCEDKIQSVGGDGVTNGICYHVVSGDKNVFNS